MNPQETNWQEANQNHLMAALAVVRETLEDKVEGGGAERAADEGDLDATCPESALDDLCQVFGLSSFERAVLLLCAGMELDSRFADLCAQRSSGRGAPTFGLALAALPDAHWSALSPEAPLRRWRLIEVGMGDALVASPMRIDERILHHLTGTPPYIDDRLRDYLEPIGVPEELVDSHEALARRIVDAWTADVDGPRPVIQLTGREAECKREIAAAACAELGLALHALAVHDVPTPPTEREALAHLWTREAVLTGSVLYLDGEELDGAETTRSLRALAEGLGGLRIMGVREPLALRRRSVRLEIARPNAQEERQIWHRALGPLAERVNGEVDAVVSQFRLGAEGIRTASAELVAAGVDGDLGRRLWSACRAQARCRLDDLAQRIEPAAGWDDLVLPENQKSVLREVATHLRHRTKVYEHWGFAAKGSRGLGISALFSGPSGTGKTMAAEVLANELELDLYRIDLSSVVSKYIGETEKNLSRVFNAAEAGGAILLFDEADALFGRRSEVRDSHDRYANLEVSYLLQRMESYGGLAILTTNRKEDLDQAFLRRIRFIVQFPFPDTTLRNEIWKNIFPTQTPIEGLATKKLADLNVSGGIIRNIAISAAFLAAATDEPVQMRHLHEAAQSEYTKLERSLTVAEFKNWK